eukprot:m.64443 g.64443  ORF g.64443 m.64443 type:complete len:141 (-) comp19547_c0_seq2:206-628(-)
MARFSGGVKTVFRLAARISLWLNTVVPALTTFKTHKQPQKVHVVAKIVTFPPERAQRREPVRIRLFVQNEGKEEVRLEVHHVMRTYDTTELYAMFEHIKPFFELIETFDFSFDANCPRDPREEPEFFCLMAVLKKTCSVP